MNLWSAAVLGLIQGITEFLPVSSSGHLVLAQSLFHWNPPGIGLEIVVHFATALAVILVLWRPVLTLFRFEGPWTRWPLTLVIVATIPAAVAGLLFEGRLEAYFDRPDTLPFFFLLTTVLLFASNVRKGSRRVTLRDALLIGLAQVLALFPGVSRSGTTITAALLLGIAPGEAFSFSFLMLLPAVGGAVLLKFTEGGLTVGVPEGVAFVVALGTGVLALWALRGVVVARKLYLFGFYTLLVALFCWWWF